MIFETVDRVSLSGPKLISSVSGLAICCTEKSDLTAAILGVSALAPLTRAKSSFPSSAETSPRDFVPRVARSFNSASMRLNLSAVLASIFMAPTLTPSTTASESLNRLPLADTPHIFTSMENALPINLRFSRGCCFLSRATSACWYLCRILRAV